MSHIGHLLADNSRLARRAFDERVRADGVTGPQARLLLMIERNPGENQGHYADLLDVEPITLCRMVDRLEDAGLVERRPDLNDRRARRLHLTEKSRAKLTRLRERLDTMVDEILTGLSIAERDEFVRLLTVVRSNLAAQREQERATHG
ncbi:MAG TPA: MarR family transcriptional regulator [Croceibacterium sp.]|nr:MarR family transcriptional regulator [Croceibacterium sp.]